jgi:plasmid stabilization system protein ParE
MARFEVIVHPAALDEAGAAAAWSRERSSDAASAFLDEIERAIAAIQQGPERWPSCGRSAHRFLMSKFPFAVGYRIRGMTVEVLAIAHGHRRPGYWRGRTA